MHHNDYPTYQSRQYCKKLQRYVTKIFRKINKLLEEDTLWNGRYVIRQIDRDYWHFADNSGGQLHVNYNIIDKKTGLILTYRSSLSSPKPFFFWGDVNLKINSFIVEESDAWHGDISPYDDKTDYTSYPLPTDWHDYHWKY